jgi:uncharacterized protein YaaW (UPF0174 family)
MGGYMYDVDLLFLNDCTNEEIEPIVTVLTKDSDGKLRISEDLTFNPLYKKHYPNHKNYLKEIIAELQHFGGNTIANKLRGSGVLYNEIVRDVASKMSVKYSSNDSVSAIESKILDLIISNCLDKMSPEEINELAINNNLGEGIVTKDLFLATLRTTTVTNPFIISAVLNAALQMLIRSGVINVAALLGGRAIFAILGPIGWVISGIFVAFDVASPAYRVTIPCVALIAKLRLEKQYEALAGGK